MFSNTFGTNGCSITFEVCPLPEGVMLFKPVRNSVNHPSHQLINEFLFDLHGRFLLNIIHMLCIHSYMLVKNDHAG